jgi:hypothetical protein
MGLGWRGNISASWCSSEYQIMAKQKATAESKIAEWIALSEAIAVSAEEEASRMDGYLGSLKKDANSLRNFVTEKEKLIAHIRVIDPELADRMAAAVAILETLLIKHSNAMGEVLKGYPGRSKMFVEYIREMPAVFASARAMANAKRGKARDPKAAAMAAMKAIFNQWQDGKMNYANDSDFAKKMIVKYPILTNEGSIKNACTRWRKDRKSSS